MHTTKIIVLDDDPTGSQTVHGCLLLTRWDTDTLREALRDASPLLFILTNTRGMITDHARAVTREACLNLRQALSELELTGQSISTLLVSRSDSTLRGHYPVETDEIANILGPFDAHFLVPAFLEGGRITRDSTHYLTINGQPVPVHETEFARDSVFGYRHSYLPDYVEEKTGGRIHSEAVRRLTLNDLHGDLSSQLQELNNNVCCVVDAECQADLDDFAAQVLQATKDGKRFLFRSAASLLTALAALPPQPVTAENMGHYVLNHRPGAIIVGSHVQKSTRQLNQLLTAPGIIALEVDVDRIGHERDRLLTDILKRCQQAHTASLSPVVYTSRAERVFPSQDARMAFGRQVSDFLMDIVAGLPDTLGFLISKGGITSNDVLSIGLKLRTSRVLGQIMPGCSIVRCPADHPRYPHMPVVIFPGNVGDDLALETVYHRLAAALAPEEPQR